MKYLNDYTEQATTQAMDKNGAFFAFGDKQLDEQKKEGIKYVSLGAGLIAPEANAKQLIDDLDNVLKAGIAEDIKENGKESIIKRELNNHEAYYTGEIEPTAEALGGYNITNDAIFKVYQSILQST